jgi:chemosensory pili system protein ChpA (sensor histidine kinase/response regulator)
MGVRLVPLGNLADRFYRIGAPDRQGARQEGQPRAEGHAHELDRSCSRRSPALRAPAAQRIAHGIEKPAARCAAGKPEIGEISIEAAQRGNEVVLTVADDGAGLNFPRIREKAVQRAARRPDVGAARAQLAQFIFMSGFSTATEVSQVAGRGVGLDVVRNEITSLGGRVEIASTPGRGTTFTVTLPLTLAVTQAVMLRAGQTVYAVPSVMIEQVQEFKSQQYAEHAARGELEWKGNRYPLRSLLPLLGEIDTPTPARQIPVLLLKSGVQRAAIRVDEIVGNREVVVKTIGPQLARLSGISGATVLGNGQVVLILNPVQLVHREQPAFEVRRARGAGRHRAGGEVRRAAGDGGRRFAHGAQDHEPHADARRLRGGHRQGRRRRPAAAAGHHARLHPARRRDAAHGRLRIRAQRARRRGTRGIPIIMITSRTADKHRNHALELGVNEYMGKPYQEDQLLA